MGEIMSKVYLTFPIEKAADKGKAISKKLRSIVEAAGYEAVSPLDFTYNGGKSLKEVCSVLSISQALEKCREVREGDINALRECQAIVAFICPESGTGTSAELTLARYLNIPVIGIIDMEVWQNVDKWILGTPNVLFDVNNCDLKKLVKKELESLCPIGKKAKIAKTRKRASSSEEQAS